MQPTSPAPRFHWRAFTSVLVGLAFLLLALSGLMLFLAPPGRVANWTNWTLLALRKSEWTAIHIWFGTIFLAMTVLHIAFNWRTLLGYFKNRVSRQYALRREWAAAGIVTAIVAAGTLVGIAPFSSLLAWNEEFKAGWEKPTEIAPIPHAELLTLAELAEKTGVPLEAAQHRLAAKGFTAEATSVTRDIANGANLSPMEIHQIIGTAPSGGTGGGLGWLSLADFCAREGLVLDTVQATLAEHGYKAEPAQTLREIAVANGLAKPVELVELMRATQK